MQSITLDRQRALTSYDALLARLRALPGVQFVGAVNRLPLTGDWWTSSIRLPERASDGPEARIPVYASRLYSTPLDELAAEAARYKAEGYRAMKLRFGWGPNDGAAGMERNLELVRTVRETVGEEIDVMADAYMGWTLDYAKRMLPRLEPFHLRWIHAAIGLGYIDCRRSQLREDVHFHLANRQDRAEGNRQHRDQNRHRPFQCHQYQPHSKLLANSRVRQTSVGQLCRADLGFEQVS